MIVQPEPVEWRRGVAAAALLMLGSFVASGIGFLVWQVVPAGAGRIAGGAATSATVGALTLATMWACGWLAFRGRAQPAWAALGLRRSRRTVSSVLLFVPITVGVVIVTGVITQVLGLTGTTEIDSDTRSQGFKLLVAFLTVVAAPWTEELSMRGFLYSGLAGRLGHWPAACISALVWASLHLTPGVLVIFTGVGIVLAWLRRRTGSILPGVGLHGSWNAIAAGSTGAGWWTAGALGLLAATIVLAVHRLGPA